MYNIALLNAGVHAYVYLVPLEQWQQCIRTCTSSELHEIERERLVDNVLLYLPEFSESWIL